MTLSKWQAVAYEKAVAGHSLAILGQAGTGKSHVMKKIITTLRLSGKTVSVTGSTGMAASHYSQFHATTYHRWCGMRDGRYTNDELLDKINNDDDFKLVKERIINTDVLIITEISMTSKSCLEQLEYICRRVRNSDSAFGHLQVIAEGDFFQLPPVPSTQYNDKGQYCFESNLWDLIFPHKIVLDEVFRQNEPDLIKAVQEISIGHPSTSTLELIESLSRPLPTSDPNTVRLFALNYDVDMYNYNKLESIVGEKKTYMCKDYGSRKELEKCPLPEVLELKVGTPVILLTNLSDELVNGRQGKVVKIEQDGPTVYFPQLDQNIKITEKSWSRYDPRKKCNIASRAQIPLKPSFAITIHKAQGMTLNSVIVDASNIFKCGQLGVAIGRATKKDGLQVVNFNKTKATLQHPAIIYEFYSSDSLPFDVDKLCCGHRLLEFEKIGCDASDLTLDPELDELISVLPIDDALFMYDTIDFDLDTETDEIIAAMNIEYDNPSDNNQDPEIGEVIDVNPNNVSDTSANKQDYSTTIDINHILDKLKSETCRQETPMQKELNVEIENLGQNKFELIKFIATLEKAFKTDLQKLSKEKHTPKDLSDLYANFHNYMKANEYLKHCQNLYSCSSLTNTQGLLCYKIASMTHSNLLEVKAQTVIKDIPHSESISKKTSSAGGRGKIRYIGGAAIATTRYNYMKCVKQNLYKPHKKDVVETYHKRVKMINTLVASEEDLMQNSCDKESLEETKLRQNIKGSLTNISDDCFTFFVALNDAIWHNLTKDNMSRYGEDLPGFVERTILENIELFDRFSLTICRDYTLPEDSNSTIDFVCDIRDTVETVSEIYKDVTSYYLKTSHNQFRKNMAKEYKRIKREAHRKSVTKKTSKQQNFLLTMQLIKDDKSENKICSHLKLKAELLENDNILKTKSFTKCDLRDLCKAYGVPFILKDAKSELSNKVRLKIISLDNIPHPEHLGQSANVSESGSNTASLPLITSCESTSGGADQHKTGDTGADEFSNDCDTSNAEPSVTNLDPTQPQTSNASAQGSDETPADEHRSSKKTKQIKQNKKTKKSRKKSCKRKYSQTCEDEDECNCPGCGLPYPQGEEDWIECEKCEEWWHRRCGGIYDKNKWMQLQNSSVSWVCLNCR